MISITLYSVTDENNKLNKTLGTGTTYTGTFRDEADVMDVTVELEIPNAQITSSSVLSRNYAYISDFGRYYFITDITVVQSNLVRFTMHIDVLMTYKTEIKAMKGIMLRQENYYNLYLNDPELKKFAYPLIQHTAFPNMINSTDYHFYLTTAGG